MDKTIYLYGELAKRFTDKIVVKADSVYKAVSALRANFPGFDKFLIEYTPGFHVRVGNIYRSEETIHEPIGSGDIHIVPAVSGGSGKVGAVFAIVIGVLMLWNPAGWAILGGTAGAGVAAFGGATGMILTSFAMGLVFAGISALLFKPPKSEVSENPENTPNTYFNGAVNTIAQGHPVPVGYGELIIGSAVISAGLESVDIS